MEDMNDSSKTSHQRVEQTVRDFYDTYGWVERDGKSGEDLSFREFRAPYYSYHGGSVQRTLRCFFQRSGTLLIAGGGDLPESHVKLARQFSEVCCLDVSQKALAIARTKLQRAYCILGSILKLPTEDNTFDAVYCAHVIYHIDIEQQEAAIQELIRVTKQGGRIVIIYSNPDSIIRHIIRLRRLFAAGRVDREHQTNQPSAMQQPALPFALQSLRWWRRFEPTCKVTILPWDVMGSQQEKVLFHSDRTASLVYRACSWIEETLPGAAARLWQYPIIVIDKPSTQALAESIRT